MLMVFTRAKRKPGQRGWLGRLFRRREAASNDDVAGADAVGALRKAAE